LEEAGWAVLAEVATPVQRHAEDAEMFGALREEIERNLTAHQREVLVSVTLNDVPIDVLAERLGSTRGALYKTLHDARRNLRSALTERGLHINGGGEKE
jgi:RNA polymerase sigma-70 factor (ECF subfamily)